MSGGSKTQTTTTRADIPAFLQPYLSNMANTGSQALSGLQDALSGGLPNRQVAGQTPQQADVLNILSNAVQPGGAFYNAHDDIVKAGLQAGNYVNRMAPMLDQGYQQALTGQFIPGSTANTLEGISSNPFQLDPTAQNALASTAAGNYMYGGPAFNEAVQASIRAANPQVLNTFGAGGSGAIKGGLADAARQQVASDAFARLYSQERQNQINAAQTLGQFGLAGRGQQLDAASSYGGLSLNQQGLRNQALGQLGNLFTSERDMQLRAAAMAPQIGLMGVNALSNAANQNQIQRQMELDAQYQNEMNPITQQQMLLAAAQGLPISSLMGQTSSSPLYRNTGAGILGGALTGAQVGGVFGPMGPIIGAIGGGLLGGMG